MYKPQFTKHKFPYVAEDGQITDGTTPYYMYVCANKDCKWCGTVDRWVGKDNNHKCSVCGKTMVRIANPKEIEWG
jgi:hypothetical protein